MIEYKANKGREMAFLNKWGKNNYILIAVLVGISILSSLNYFIKMDVEGIIFMLITCIFFFWWFIVRSAIREANTINLIVDSVTVDGTNVKFVTISFSVLFGLIKRESIQIEFEKGTSIFEAPKPNYPLNNKSLESPYIIRNQNREFFLVEGFFENFGELMRNLEKI